MGIFGLIPCFSATGFLDVCHQVFHAKEIYSAKTYIFFKNFYQRKYKFSCFYLKMDDPERYSNNILKLDHSEPEYSCKVNSYKKENMCFKTF